MDTPEAQQQAAAALKHIARNETIKAYILQQPPLYTLLRRAAERFIAGETLTECLQTAEAAQAQGHAVTIDYMGESTRDHEAAEQATEEFLQVIALIEHHHLTASVSLDLSHVGLAIDPDLALTHMERIVQAAERVGSEVMISMEGAERTAEVLAMHQRLGTRFANVGITLQAYLPRTAQDLAAALTRPGRIRLVKGAFEEPADRALPRGPQTDAAYRDYLERLLMSGHRCSIATHDPALLADAQRLIEQSESDPTLIEFEMLRGATPEQLQALHDQGYNTRVYLPYGREWYLYLCHRLAEYPPNIYQAIADAAFLVAR